MRQTHLAAQAHPHRLGRVVVVLLAACAILLALASRAEGAQVVITSSGPLTNIYLNNDLACQLSAAGDATSEFFGGTNPGACGTFLSVFSVTGGASAVYGPSVPAGPTPNAGDFTPTTQSAVTGSGTSASPFQVVTTDAVGLTGLQITQTDSYVVGDQFYTTAITVQNTGTASSSGTLFHAGDCFLANQDTGFGALLSGAAFCTLTANNNPPSGTLGFVPLNSPGGNYVEGFFATVWSDVAGGAALPNTVDATINQDNGTGISWPLVLAGGASQTKTLRTQLVRGGPTATASSAGCGGLVNFTVMDAPGGRGAQSVHYRLDGGAEQVLPTSGNPGTASLGVNGDGNHTLEYWGENAAAVQEIPHNLLSLQVDTRPPVVSITSDQGRSSYSLGQAASVSISAIDATSGLASDPSAARVPISTSGPGSFTVQRSASDKCGNTATASFTYRVTGPPPPPVLFKSVDIAVVSGRVFVLLPGGGTSNSAKQATAALPTRPAKGIAFVPLTEARQLPLGTIVDTTEGVARVASAANSKGKTQSGDFGAGIFKVLQKRRERGLTDLDLVVASTARRACTTQVGKARAARARRLSHRVLDLLRSDVAGHFRTRGRFSAATVRGTNWDMVERCDGTLTRVHRGTVLVADFRRRRNILLHPGKSYLARAR